MRRVSEASALQELRRITTLMRARTGHDFSSYKRATLLRRIARRMQSRATPASRSMPTTSATRPRRHSSCSATC